MPYPPGGIESDGSGVPTWILGAVDRWPTEKFGPKNGGGLWNGPGRRTGPVEVGAMIADDGGRP